jgi:hypothetical protein
VGRETCNRCFGKVDAETLRCRLGLLEAYVRDCEAELAHREAERDELASRLHAFGIRE